MNFAEEGPSRSAMLPAGRFNMATHDGGEARLATTTSNGNVESSAVIKPMDMAPVVPVAAAPRKDNLYETMLRYHNEHDSSSDEETTRRRRRRAARGGATGGYRSCSDDEDFDGVKPSADSTGNGSFYDRKLPALRSSQLKSPPPATGIAEANTLKSPSAGMSAAAGVGGPKEFPAPSNFEINRGNFYEAALAESRIHDASLAKPISPKPAKKPGIVQVNEPGINPTSTMYRAAYGALGTQGTPESADNAEATHTRAIHAKPSPVVASAVTAASGKRKPRPRNHGLGLSQSQHSPRTRSLEEAPGGTHHSKPNRRSSTDAFKPPTLVGSRGAPPIGFSKGPKVEPHDFMMNVGNDLHFGYGNASPGHEKSTKTGKRNKSPNRPKRNASPKRFPILSGMRKRLSDFPMRHAAEAATASKEIKEDVAPRHTVEAQVLAQVKPSPSMPTAVATPASIPTAVVTPVMGNASSQDLPLNDSSPQYSDRRRNSQWQPASDHQNELTAHVELAAPTRHVGLLQDDQMDEELRLALELSKQDSREKVSSGFHNQPPPMTNRQISGTNSSNSTDAAHSDFAGGRTTHEDQSMHSSLADVMLALKLSAEESSMTNPQDHRKSTNLDELLALEMAQETHQSMTDFVAAGITSEPSDQDEQMRILEKIRQEQEQKELELAIQASQAASRPQMAHQTSGDFLMSQHQAMNEYARPNAKASGQVPVAANTRPVSQRQDSHRSFDSAGRRQELLERGTSETKLAIQSGKAQVVICRGCGGRLQAPASYSLVFCPKCQTISPA